MISVLIYWYMKFILIFVGVVVLWSLWGIFSSRVEQAEYSVVEQKDGYEIRNYTKHLVARVTVTGTYDETLNEGFRIIAAYIFGENTTEQKIAMTAPVTEQKVSEKIAMTAPVTSEQTDEETRIISFVMPRSYTMETLPRPVDTRIQIVEVPEKKMAALSFSWFRNAKRVEKKETELLSLLDRDQVTVVGNPIYAGYNDPWTPPWLTRSDILVEVK